MSGSAERQVLCTQLAQRQHGVLSVEQALEIGMSRAGISRLVASDRWRWALPRVVVPGAYGLSFLGRASAASRWAPDGAVSHVSAAAVWGLLAAAPEEIHVTTASSLKAPPGLIVHSSRTLQAQETKGIRVTTVARTLLDLAAGVNTDELEAALEEGLRRRLTSIPSLERFVGLAGGKGRPGTAALRDVVARYKGSPTESYLERKVLPLFRRNGLPDPITQLWITVDCERYRLDFAYPSARVGIEAHSFKWHTGRKSWAHDVRRLNALFRSGWTILFITDEDVDDHGRRFFINLRQILAARGFFPPRLPLTENLDGKLGMGASTDKA